jgi:GT2 family glycosyltransferase
VSGEDRRLDATPPDSVRRAPPPPRPLGRADEGAPRVTPRQGERTGAGAPTGEVPRIAVVIPTFNRRAALARVLEELGRQSLAPTLFEVVVVDDGSTDGTADWLHGRTFPYALRVVAGEHGGPSRARNLGIEAARAPRVLFLDDDVLPVRDNLAEHLAAADANGPERTVVIGPLSPPPGVPRPPWLRWVDRTLERQYRALAAGEYAPSARQFYTANASVPRALLTAVGGFDPTFLRGEDVELAYRLARAGATFAFAPRADVHHHAAHSFATWRRTSYQYGRYDVLMEREKGLPALRHAARELHGRHRLTRVLARATTGRPALARATEALLTVVVDAADRVGAEGAAMLALSGLANLLYWQGVADALGGREATLRLIGSARSDGA